MNTTATATATQSETTTRPAPTAGQRRKLRLLGILALFLGAFAPALALAQPAEAAGSYSTGIYFCGPTAYANVSLEIWDGRNFVAYKYGKTGSNGCGTFRYVDAGYAYQVSMYTQYRVPYNCRASWTRVYSTGWAVARANQVTSVGNMAYRGQYAWC